VTAEIAASALYYALPDSLSVGPPWLLVAVVALLLVPTVLTHRAGRERINEWLGGIVNAVLTAALVWSIGALIVTLPSHRAPPVVLLRTATILWITTVVVFSSWYWRLDAGGPNRRDRRRHAGERHTRGAFLFPQMTIDTELVGHHCELESHWSPQYVDYLFLAFTTSTAFSPTDVPVLSRWAKVLMMTQAVMSLATLALLAARAVNIL
jgi:uncharacterized membrane protein